MLLGYYQNVRVIRYCQGMVYLRVIRCIVKGWYICVLSGVLSRGKQCTCL